MNALLIALLILAALDLAALCAIWIRRRQRRIWSLWVRGCDLGRTAKHKIKRSPPATRIQVDKMNHYLQTPGGRRRTVKRG